MPNVCLPIVGPDRKGMCSGFQIVQVAHVRIKLIPFHYGSSFNRICKISRP